MKNGVVLSEHQDSKELLDLDAGTPIAVNVDGCWWAYVSDGAGNVSPVGEVSYSDHEQALQAARDKEARLMVCGLNCSV
ncbi:hypothetical protein [Pseudomonas sp. GOM6]|uniref:hypothetical protein n=1 Tax=Pseudomonas sp. GOM6 TaxID=3036944 RepID=UPI00240A8EBA|nr:hypothetical protein [Pseudomonas sp. GOM6]MDG1580967.1 hypothetical protein [Pseudomonas sp. GOM6]